jgi:DNA-binding transcriptional LysR family regulator
MLMALDAAARAGSFTAAARELNLTQGAISRQVSALEDQLDVILFERAGKTVLLTEAGKVYAREIGVALQTIRNASLNAMTNPLSGILNLAILPTFGTRWLMPRFPSFLKEHPNITVNFVTKLTTFDFHEENLQAAIHYGQPDWPDAISTFLMGEKVIPVCSPGFLDENPLSHPGDMARLPLLQLTTRPDAWDNWFRSNKIDPPQEQGMAFEQFSIIAQAAVAGLGVALLPKFLIQSELDRKELVVILNMPTKSEDGYYLVTPADKSEHATVTALREWLLNVVG